jgi:hypothetical protein
MNVLSMANVCYRGRRSEMRGEMMIVRWKLNGNYEKRYSGESGCQEEKRKTNEHIDKMPIRLGCVGALRNMSAKWAKKKEKGINK